MTHDHAIVSQSAPERGAAEPFDRFEAPAPGSYWRLRKNCKGRSDERMSAPAMMKGTVLMLARVEFADGAPHVYTFAPHPGVPEDDRDDTAVHADDFFTWFERAPDGEAVRAAELLALMGQMEETKLKMLSPPPDAVPAALLGYDPTPAIGEPGQALATPALLQAMTLRAERLKEDAEKRSNWIQTHSSMLGAQGAMLANFHQERAEAALARAQSQLEGVAGILKTVANLRLYTGEGIELMVLRHGAPAAPDEPLTIFQDVLSLDEEAAVLLDGGGLDHTQTDVLIEALADPALLTRLIPTQRGVVLVRFRSSYKEFTKPSAKAGKHDRAAAARFNSEMSDESKRKRLLVRDGERLWLIDADSVLAPIKQLLPSAGEQAGYFQKSSWDRRHPPRQITREDISYAKAQREQLGALDHYAQVLIMLWGLRDRIDLFEDAHIPKFSSWLDPAFQNAYLRLLSKDTLIGVERPSFSAWQASQNEYLVPGAWVAVDLAQAFSEERAPGAYTRGRYYNGSTHHDLIYKPDVPDGCSGVVFERVQSDMQGQFIEIPGRYDGYNDRVRRRTITIKLYLRHRDTTSRSTIADGVLVLDRVHRADLSYYLESRVERRNYERYLKLFRQARLWVDARDQREEPLRAQLRQAVLDGRLPHDPDQLDAQLTAALAVARTARRDREVPLPATPAFQTFFKSALAALHAGLTDHGARVSAVDAWAAHAGRQPLRLVLTGKEAWKLYLVPTPDEHDARLGEPAHASWGLVTFGGDGSAEITVQGRALLRAAASEQVIHDWQWDVPALYKDAWDRERGPKTVPAGASAWLSREPSFSLSYADAVSLLDCAITQSAHLDAGIDPGELVVQARRYMRDASKKHVERMRLSAAIGSGLTGNRPLVLFASIDALVFAFHTGDEKTRQACRAAVREVYARPDAAMARLEESSLAWSVSVTDLETAWPARKERYIRRNIGAHIDRERLCSTRTKKPPYRAVVVQSLTPAGARLFPWLAELTERAVG